MTDHFFGQQPASAVRRTRSGSTRTLGGVTALSAILSAAGANTSVAMHEYVGFDDHMAMQAALTIPKRIAIFFPINTTTLRQAKAFPEWPQWKGAVGVQMAVGLV